MIIPYKDNSFFLNRNQIDGIIEKLSAEEIPEAAESRKQFDEDRTAVYKMIISNIITISFADEEIIPLWDNIIRHKYLMSEKLKRDVGFRVAALDYLFNIEQRAHNPMIIENTSYESLVNEAQKDFKTGLYNSRTIYRYIDQEIDRSKRYGLVFTLLFIDLDNFKQYNDTLGHLAGDSLLSDFAGEIQQQLRSIDMAARFGGDEFCILFPQTHRETAIHAANRIQRLLNTIVSRENRKKTAISISGGLVMFPFNGTSRRELFQAADTVLYRAKQEGKDRILEPEEKIYTPVFNNNVQFEIKERDKYHTISADEIRLQESGLLISLKNPELLADPEILGIHIRLVVDSETHSLMLARDRIQFHENNPWLKITFYHEPDLMTMILQRLVPEKTFYPG